MCTYLSTEESAACTNNTQNTNIYKAGKLLFDYV